MDTSQRHTPYQSGALLIGKSKVDIVFFLKKKNGIVDILNINDFGPFWNTAPFWTFGVRQEMDDSTVRTGQQSVLASDTDLYRAFIPLISSARLHRSDLTAVPPPLTFK